MTRVLISSRKHDVHSIALQQALREDGHFVFRWLNANFPEKQCLSYFADNGIPCRMTIGEFSSKIDESEVDVVWLRRPSWASLPDYIHPSDMNLAAQECNIFIRSLWQTAFSNAIWVNSLEARRAANSKSLQLKLATQVGLTIPNSLISNDPDEIATFISNAGDSVIVKPLMGGGVHDNDGHLCRTFTARITLDRLPSRKYVQACPCIYQVETAKAHEVRATFFGATVVVVRIDSQSNNKTKVDWRASYDRNLVMQEIEMPNVVYQSCRRLMASMSLIYGTFDFAVTPDGEWIFFEVNEAGQFLWIESAVPSIKMLEIAAKFFGAPSFDFLYKSDGPIKSLADVYKSSAYAATYENDAAYNDDSVAISAAI